MKILIAIDREPSSADALSFAKTIVPEDAEVTVLNVAELGITPMGAIGTFAPGFAYAEALSKTATPDVIERVDAEARHLTADAAHELDEAAESVRTKVVHGEAGNAICRLADEEHFDLIVLGTHDRNAWSRFWFGSVSDHVVHHAPCSVLVVR